MYKSFFQNIATEQGGTFLYQDQDTSIGGGIRLPKVQYLLKIPIGDTEMNIINITGKEFSGHISMKLPKQPESHTFELTTNSHIKSLFIGKSKRFNINSDSSQMTEFLRNNSHIAILKEIAQEDSFQPIITGTNEDDHYMLIAKYHLEFDNWNSPVLPLMDLFKELHTRFVVNNERFTNDVTISMGY
ncbi:hypothetical protein [Dokdonia sp. R86516]|uniref:hypothetical protein n=1 Tax=Dokdonia sp. R86516 TaxID=3093856 RepID=UPI0037CB9DAA